MRVGENEAVKRADRVGLALIDEEPDGRAVSNIRALGAWLQLDNPYGQPGDSSSLMTPAPMLKWTR